MERKSLIEPKSLIVRKSSLIEPKYLNGEKCYLCPEIEDNETDENLLRYAFPWASRK